MKENQDEWRYIKRIMARQRAMPEILRMEKEENIPVSLAQQRLWVIQEVDPSNYAYNMFFPFSMEGRLDISVFDEAVNQVIERYEIFRTTFEAQEGVPYQILHAELKIKTEEKQFYGDKELAFAWIMEQTKKPFDLKKLPLIKTFMAEISENQSYLLLLMHHIIGDAGAMNIVLEEIQELYNGKLSGNVIKQEEPELQFSDYAVWERDNYKKFLDERAAYWVEKLPKQITNLNLPTDYPRPAAGSFLGKMIKIPFDKELYAGLQEIRKHHPGVTMFMVLVAAYRVLLYRFIGERDILIGVPMANRMHKNTKRLVGYLANMVVLYTDINEEATFTELLKEEKQTCLEAYEDQDFPYEYLLEKIEYKRELNRNPLFQTAVTFQDVAEEELYFGEARAKVIDVQREAAMFDILMLAYDNGDCINGWFEYSTALFHETTVELFAQRFCLLLKQIIRDQDIKIKDIELCLEEETEKICGEWNATNHSFSENICLQELFENKAGICGDRIALVNENAVLTYRELNQRANRLARYLCEQVKQKNSFIGICMSNSFEMVSGLLAILKSGHVYVPLDPEIPDERIHYMLADCGIEVVLTESKYRYRFDEFSGKAICLDRHNFEMYSDKNQDLERDPDQLAYVIYTSGTTGFPKGVMMRHRSVVNVIEWVNRTFEINETDRLLLVASISFDLSVYDIFGLLAAGGSIFLPEREQVREPIQLLNIIDNYGITFWDSAPAVLMQLTPFLHERKCENTSLRLVFLSGDWIPVSLPKKLQESFPNAKLIALGGATEAAIWSNYYITDPKEEYWESIPYGRPIQNCRYYILDQNKKLCPIGVEGNLYIGGRCLAAGYRNKPELTEEKFIDCAIGSEMERIYFTGDRAKYLMDGNIKFLGRRDSQLKIRGFRIELEEIRNILEMHPRIEHAVVLAEGAGKEDKQLAAFLVMKQEWPEFEGKIKEYLERKLPYYMIPKKFIEVSHIPYGNNGKLEEKQLREASGKYMEVKRILNAQTKLQENLLEIFRFVLNTEQIGIDTDFFEAGGHSLLAAKLIAKIKEDLNIEVMARDIFMASNVRNLERYIVEGDQGQQYVSLEEEASLILDENADSKEYGGRKDRFFMTGCTGFIGRFLLHQLLETSNADVYCLLNKEHQEDAYCRLKSILKDNELWQDSFESRIIPVIGSLKEENMGMEKEQYRNLAEIVDVIYHNGAIASYLDHYNTLKSVNVYGTEQIIKFAALSRKKAIHFSSTITVFNADDYRTVTEDTSILQEKHEYYPGYFASKWVAEELINQARKHNIPCNIYRFGLMTGDTEKGRYDSRQWMYQLQKSFLILGHAFHKMPDFNHAILPIDTAVKIVCEISYKDDLLNRNYFICNPKRFAVQDFVKTYNRNTGSDIKIIDFYDWLRVAEAYMKDHDDLVIYYFVQHLAQFSREELDEYINNEQRRLDINAENTGKAIADLGIEIPELSDGLIMKYYEYIIQNEPELKKGIKSWK